MAQMTSNPEQVSELPESDHHDIEEMIAKVNDNSGAARDTSFTALSWFLAAPEAARETFIHPSRRSAGGTNRSRGRLSRRCWPVRRPSSPSCPAS